VPPQGPNEWDQFFRDIHTQSARGASLIGAALVEACLKQVLITRMHKEVEPEEAAIFENESAPLASFSQRIALAWAIGIIGPNMKKRLTSIRMIRNAFAHALAPIDFDTPLVRNEAMTLPLHLIKDPALPAEWPEAKRRFVSTCLIDAHDLSRYYQAHGGGVMYFELD
jgi:hypothetical protein